jgi:hypothetical protein
VPGQFRLIEGGLLFEDFHFNQGPRLVSGMGVGKRNVEILPTQHILFVTDPGVRSLGQYGRALAGLRRKLVPCSHLGSFSQIGASGKSGTLHLA